MFAAATAEIRLVGPSLSTPVGGMTITFFKSG
jgi:hypothetical protein